MFGLLCANAPCAGNALCENAFSFLCSLVLWQPSGAPRIIHRNSDNRLPVSCAELPSSTACTNLLIAISCSPLNRIVSRKSRSCRGRGAHARAHAHTNTHTHTLHTGPTKHIRAHTQTPFLATGGPGTRGACYWITAPHLEQKPGAPCCPQPEQNFMPATTTAGLGTPVDACESRTHTDQQIQIQIQIPSMIVRGALPSALRRAVTTKHAHTPKNPISTSTEVVGVAARVSGVNPGSTRRAGARVRRAHDILLGAWAAAERRLRQTMMTTGIVTATRQPITMPARSAGEPHTRA